MSSTDERRDGGAPVRRTVPARPPRPQRVHPAAQTVLATVPPRSIRPLAGAAELAAGCTRCGRSPFQSTKAARALPRWASSAARTERESSTASRWRGLFEPGGAERVRPAVARPHRGGALWPPGAAAWLRVVAVVVVVAFGARAGATAKTVTLLGVSGVDGAKFARALQEELGELYDLVPGDKYKRTAIRIGHLGAAPEDVMAVARAIGADAIIGGAIAGHGRNRQLLIAVREGASGRVISRGRYGLMGRTLPLIKERVAADLVRALERVRPVGEAAPAQAEPEQEPSVTRDEAPPGEVPPPLTEDVSPAAATDVSLARSGPRRAVAGVQAAVGPSLLTRSLGFDVASAPGYSGGTVAGMRVEGAVFPLALSAELAAEHPVLASFGFAGSYEYVFSFTSATASGSSSGHASRWDVRFVGRVPLGHGAKAGVLTLDTGLEQMSWSHAAPVDVGVPDVRYDLVGGGLGWERALGSRWFILGVRLGVMGLLSAGDIASQAQYGPAGGWGLEVSGGWTARPRDWLWFRLRGNWERIALSFAGAGTRFAKSAADNWIGGALEVGFAL